MDINLLLVGVFVNSVKVFLTVSVLERVEEISLVFSHDPLRFSLLDAAQPVHLVLRHLAAILILETHEVLGVLVVVDDELSRVLGGPEERII